MRIKETWKFEILFKLGPERVLHVFIYDVLEMFPCVVGVFTGLSLHLSARG